MLSHGRLPKDNSLGNSNIMRFYKSSYCSFMSLYIVRAIFVAAVSIIEPFCYVRIVMSETSQVRGQRLLIHAKLATCLVCTNVFFI